MTASKSVSLKTFFEEVPPGQRVALTDLPTIRPNLRSSFQASDHWEFNLPAIQLHCDSEHCSGTRFFDTDAKPMPLAGKTTSHFAGYSCRNCSMTSKTYAFMASFGKDKSSVEVQKFGEIPQFGPPTPARLISLIGPERDYFLKGRRAENQGLGIAAFAYYRRVVENQRNRIFDELIRVATKLSASTEMLRDLETAKSESQFSKAVEAIKHGIPEALLIDGHNPLMLLHSALSEGLHTQTDENCLEVATSIRVVLAELVQRTEMALKEEAELKSAVSKLLSLKATNSVVKPKS